eukprot:scaffold160782_cov21-Tisochrysis_lutea.AAC.1
MTRGCDRGGALRGGDRLCRLGWEGAHGPPAPHSVAALSGLWRQQSPREAGAGAMAEETSMEVDQTEEKTGPRFVVKK